MRTYTIILRERIFRNLLMVAVFIAPVLASAQENCGTITKSVRLQSDCIGPLVVGANNVTIDLNGHTVFAGPESDVARGSIEVFNKRKVRVKNGIVRGSAVGLYVTGGKHTRSFTTPSLLSRRIHLRSSTSMEPLMRAKT